MRAGIHRPPASGVQAIAASKTINRRWLPLNALRAFDAVGQRMSFTAGGQDLDVSQSAVSRHVISPKCVARSIC